jgi:hypothetical protein
VRLCHFLKQLFDILVKGSSGRWNRIAVDPSTRVGFSVCGRFRQLIRSFFADHRGRTLYPMDADRLRAIYPTLTDEELKEADVNLRRYFACALQIASETHPGPVDSSERLVTIKERSNNSSNNIPFEHG